MCWCPYFGEKIMTYCIRRKIYQKRNYQKQLFCQLAYIYKIVCLGNVKIWSHCIRHLIWMTEPDVKSQAVSHKKTFYEHGHTEDEYTFCLTQNSILMLTYQETFFGCTEASSLFEWPYDLNTARVQCCKSSLLLPLPEFCSITAARALCYPFSHHNCCWPLLHLHCKVKRYQRWASRKKQA